MGNVRDAPKALQTMSRLAPRPACESGADVAQHCARRSCSAASFQATSSTGLKTQGLRPVAECLIQLELTERAVFEPKSRQGRREPARMRW